MNVKKCHLYGNQDWITPYPLINLLGGADSFDLDPCAAEEQPWSTAKNYYSVKDDGLKQTWFGSVFMSPPWGSISSEWVKKAIFHGNVTALLPCRPDTKLFQDYVLPNAYALFFLRGRVHYHDIKGNSYGSSTSPSVLVAFDDASAKRLMDTKLEGFYIQLKK
jgi:hypothetical protein